MLEDEKKKKQGQSLKPANHKILDFELTKNLKTRLIKC